MVEHVVVRVVHAGSEVDAGCCGDVTSSGLGVMREMAEQTHNSVRRRRGLLGDHYAASHIL